ncbi:MAG: DUF6249 domain-containing protein [Bacteroidaceae bacterium]|nr:DUF6249 domain-containing protein [Bacteroidaceae bacterium]
MNSFILVQLLVPISICVVLPVMIVWIVAKARAQEVNKRTEVILAAIEKNSDLDVDKFFQKMSPEKHTIKERLLAKHQKGLIMTVIGGSGLIGCIAWLLFLPYDEFVVFVMSVVFVALLAVGIGFFVNYKVGKKMLEKEMQAELDNMSVASKSGEQSQTPVCKQTDISDSAEAREDTDRVEADE